MSKVKDIVAKDERENLNRIKQPEWIKPMLATLTHDVFSNKGWIFERKLDGERCIVVKKGNSVKLFSRNKKILNDTYPELYKAFKDQKGNFIIDGEVVAFNGKITSFQKLQERMQIKNKKEAEKSSVKVYYYAFDIVFADRYELKKVPLSERKKVLKKLISYKDPLRFTIHKNEKGEKHYKEACSKGWEGLIAKDIKGNYVSSRSKKWLKLKCVNRQEFVIGGYTEPDGERIGFGALLIGFYKNGNLKYAGKVGTGYDDETLKKLHKKMKRLKKDEPPFDSKNLPSSDVNWIKPKLVAEIGFTEWTRQNRLRHPRYLGLRNDKAPKKVVKEE